MEGEGHALPHEPAPPEPRQVLPPTPLLARGLGLGAVAAVMAWLAFVFANRSLFLAPVAAIFTVVAALSAWASAIQLTGGVKHDDHPFL